MTKPAQNKPQPPKAKKPKIVVHFDDGRIMALSSLADDVVERQVTKALAGGALRQTVNLRAFRAQRAPHLLSMEREIRELKKVVEALAVRSVVHDQSAKVADSVDFEGMTVLDAETAYQLLDNPPKPTEALSAILALR